MPTTITFPWVGKISYFGNQSVSLSVSLVIGLRPTDYTAVTCLTHTKYDEHIAFDYFLSHLSPIFSEHLFQTNNQTKQIDEIQKEIQTSVSWEIKVFYVIHSYSTLSEGVSKKIGIFIRLWGTKIRLKAQDQTMVNIILFSQIDTNRFI